MTRRILRTIAVGALASCSLVGAIGSAQAAPVTMKFSHWVPTVHPLHKAFVAWAKSVTEKSGGSIKFQFFPSGQLGKGSDHFDMAKAGIADIVWINPGFNPGRWPVTALPEQPLMMKDALGASRALTRWYADYAAKEMGDVKFCLMHTMSPQTIYSTKRQIKSPADLKGVKMRPSNATQAQVFKRAGAVTVFSPFPKIRDTLERGIATATTGTPGSLIVFGGAKATKYAMDAPLFGAVWAFVINKRTYGKLDAKQKAVIDAHCSPEEAAKIAQLVVQYDDAGQKKLKAMGKTFTAVSDADLKAWRALAAPVLAKWRADVAKRGFDADQVRQSLISKLKAEKALVE